MTTPTSSPPTMLAAEIAGRRRAAFERLSGALRDGQRADARPHRRSRTPLSDLQFTERYRVPFQFSPHVSGTCPPARSSTPRTACRSPISTATRFYDLTGSYGVNLLGYDFYKACMERGAQRVECARPGAGRLPVAGRRQRARGWRAISGKRRGLVPHVGHRSGHAGRAPRALPHAALAPRAFLRRLSWLVGRRAARHRQPGAGRRHLHAGRNVRAHAGACCTTRRDIACVLVNPLAGAASQPRRAGRLDPGHSRADRSVDRAAYAAWLRELRAICTERGIVLIFDEVFVGFRLAPRRRAGIFRCPGRYRDLRQDGGRRPAGRRRLRPRTALMKRFRDDRPADICFARGTFNSHPYVMAAMNEFLRHLDGPEMAALYRDLDATWDGRAASLNRRLAERGLPLQVAALSSIWTVCLHGRVALQLDAAILPQGRRPGPELGRHRPAGFQPQLQRCRLRGRGRALPGRRRGDARATAGGSPAHSAPTAPSSAASCAR